MLDPLADEYVQADQDDPALLFTAAYNNFAGPVFGYLRARGVDDPEAVTQDVFLALYPKLETLHGGLQGGKNPVVLHRACADGGSLSQTRTNARRDAVRTRPGRAAVAIGRRPGLRTGCRLGVTEILDDLPDDYREVLALRVVADVSVEDTAAIMGKSQGAVKQLQRRALSALKKRALLRNGTS